MTKADVAGVIKADAYGTGARQVFEILRAQNCTRFFVATPEEALSLDGKDCDIFVLGGLYHGVEDVYRDGGIIPILNSAGDIARWAAHSRKLGMKLPAALHVDTGMNRLGIGTAYNKEDLDALDLKLVMSHFACSDEKDHPMNDAQARDFAAFVTAFPSVPKSLSNSSGLFRNKDWHHDIVRPGYALYGGNPMPEDINPVRPVVSLDVRILQTRQVKKGQSAGYNATHVFEKDTRLATVAMGYADGFLRSGSNKAKLFWNGQPCPIVGRVSMDLIIVDIGGITGVKPEEGNWLEVLGPSQSVDQLATDCSTIGYEILTSLGRRYHRVYQT